jgi:Cu(I)/Ag(I) efflux system membrane protein CusA/SilA
MLATLLLAAAWLAIGGLRHAQDLASYLPSLPFVSLFVQGGSWLLLLAAVSLLLYLAVRTQRLALTRTVALASLLLIGLWSYRFTKIGVDFMPLLDEGTTLDMPVTVPRVSVTQSADDLKARDALLRGFPEVESVIGKAGRADTPTDPAPLDMVETFVNFRPKELWPKRVLPFADAERQTAAVLQSLEDNHYVAVAKTHDERASLLDDASQKALERFDETMRELALLRYREIERELAPTLTRFAIVETIRMLGVNRPLRWPTGVEQDQFVDRLTQRFTPLYGDALAKHPSLEDTAQLSQAIAAVLEQDGAIREVAAALQAESSLWSGLRTGVLELFGAETPTFAGQLLEAIAAERDRAWQAGVRRVDWELFDHGVVAYTQYAIEEIAKLAVKNGLIEGICGGGSRLATWQAFRCHGLPCS